MKEYQTIIIGAGPAGLMAGKDLKDSLILDKKKEIGEPVQCGEGLSQKSLEKQGIEPNSSWICCNIHAAVRVMPNAKSFGKRYQEPLGYIIDRVTFEKFLAKECQAEIKLNCRVVDIKKLNGFWQIGVENGQTFKSKYLIGADGATSIVRKKVFPENEAKTEFVPAIEYLVETEKEMDTEKMEMHFDNEKYPSGYAWIFPKSKNTANIGLCAKNVRVPEVFEEFLRNTVEKIYGSCKLLKNKSGIIPLSQKGFSFFKDNAFLAGDAAGLADPLFKGGISQAMQSGRIAGLSIFKDEINQYESKTKEMLSVNEKILEASRIFYSFDNQMLNELGDVLEGRGTSYLKTLPGIRKFLSKPSLRKNYLKLFKFFTIWWKNRDYLW